LLFNSHACLCHHVAPTAQLCRPLRLFSLTSAHMQWALSPAHTSAVCIPPLPRQLSSPPTNNTQIFKMACVGSTAPTPVDTMNKVSIHPHACGPTVSLSPCLSLPHLLHFNPTRFETAPSFPPPPHSFTHHPSPPTHPLTLPTTHSPTHITHSFTPTHHHPHAPPLIHPSICPLARPPTHHDTRTPTHSHLLHPHTHPQRTHTHHPSTTPTTTVRADREDQVGAEGSGGHGRAHGGRGEEGRRGGEGRCRRERRSPSRESRGCVCPCPIS
jgi:hypothetical protein